MCLCVWVVCLCKGVVVVCVSCCESVSECVCVCVYVLFGCVVICSCTENGDGDHGVSVVVCHNIVLCCVVLWHTATDTHTMNTNTTLHRKTVTNTLTE